MIIGGQAVLIYGEPRNTKDIDITLGVGPERLEDVLAAVRSLGWKVAIEDPTSFVPKFMVLPCQDPDTGIPVELIFTNSPYEREAIKRVTRKQVDGYWVCYASIEDLLIHKIVAGRPRDLEDVKILLLKQRTFDAEHVRDWLAQFDESLHGDYSGLFDSLWRNSSS